VGTFNEKILAVENLMKVYHSVIHGMGKTDDIKWGKGS
jgi:hypothetical protein